MCSIWKSEGDPADASTKCIHRRAHKHHSWVPHWKADAIIKAIFHLLIFKGLPSFQYISHFCPPLHLNLSIHLSVLMSLAFAASQSIPSLWVCFVFYSPLSVWELSASCQVCFSINSRMITLIKLPLNAFTEGKYNDRNDMAFLCFSVMLHFYSSVHLQHPEPLFVWFTQVHASSSSLSSRITTRLTRNTAFLIKKESSGLSCRSTRTWWDDSEISGRKL